MGDYEKSIFNFVKLKNQNNGKIGGRNMKYALIDCLFLNHVNDKIIYSILVDNVFNDAIEKQKKGDEKNSRVTVKLRTMCSSKMQQILDEINENIVHEKYEILKKRCIANELAIKGNVLIKFISISYDECKNIQNMIIQIRSTQIKLKNLNV